MGKKTTVRIVNSQHDGSHDMAFWDFSRERETVLLRDWNPRAKSLAAGAELHAARCAAWTTGPRG